MNFRTLLKTSVAAIALFSVPGAVLGADNTLSTGQPKVNVKLYGLITKAILWADDGTSSRAMIVDNDNMVSRWGLIANAPVSENVSFGAKMEYEFQSNSSSDVSLHTGSGDTGQGQTNFVERIAEVTMAHKQLGKLSLGQGPTASDGTAEVDLGNTYSVLYSGAIWFGGISLRFRNDSTGAVGPAMGSVVSNLDGLSRNDRVKYDSPSFGGFNFATSYVSGGAADVGVNYGNKWGRVQVAAAAGYWNDNSVTTGNKGGWDASASLLDDSGINFTLAGGKGLLPAGSTNPDPRFVYGKVGYIAKFFPVGTTNFGIDFGKYDSFNGRSTDGTAWGIGAVQHFADTGAELYIVYRNYKYDAPGTNFHDLNYVMTGLQVQF